MKNAFQKKLEQYKEKSMKDQRLKKLNKERRLIEENLTLFGKISKIESIERWQRQKEKIRMSLKLRTDNN